MKKLNQIGPDLRKFAGKFSTKANMSKISKEGARYIKLRTRGGKGLDDRRLDPLAESTKKIKRKNNISTKSRLTDTKKMLDAIKGKAVRTGKGVIYFRSGEMEDRAAWNELGDPTRNRPSRIFFGLSRKDTKKLTNFIRTIYRKITSTGV